MAIQIKSFNQILGDMIRKIVAETALNDLNAGSVLLTLLEAAAANDFSPELTEDEEMFSSNS